MQTQPRREVASVAPIVAYRMGEGGAGQDMVIHVVLFFVVRRPIRMLGLEKWVQRHEKKRHDYGYPVEAHGQDIQATKEM
jgi:CO/xanthine dehydrogenase FAD-binding subunit